MTLAIPAAAASRLQPAGPRHPLWTVQLLRAAAALMVVAGHAQSATAGVLAGAGRPFARSTVLPWGASIDLFFVVSGFIMVHASDRLFGRAGAIGEFLRRRLLRIVPLYWIVTTLFLLLLVAAHLKGGDLLPDGLTILASYAFVPHAAPGTSGMFPIYDLGWTLNYELFFYALFALTLPLPRGRALAVLGVTLVILVAIGRWLPPGTAAWFWTRPILLDFGLGVLVGAASVDGTLLSPRASIGLIGIGVVLLALDPARLFQGPPGVTVANELPRVVLAGIPAAAILAGVVLVPRRPLPGWARPWVWVGDASYSIYLLHPLALIGMEKIAQKAGSGALPAGWVVAWCTSLAGVALALAGYRWLERPITAALHGRRAPGRAAALAAKVQENPS